MKLGMKITAITGTDLDGFRVSLRFANGKAGTVSLNNIFSPPRNLSAEVLKGGMFAKCFVENGALAWPNGLELCPDAVYHWMELESGRERSELESSRERSELESNQALVD